MFTARLHYLDGDQLARILVRQGRIGRVYFSLDTLVEGIMQARRSAGLTETSLIKCLSKLLYCQRNVFEDPMPLHLALKDVKAGESFDAAFERLTKEYWAKRGIRKG